MVESGFIDLPEIGGRSVTVRRSAINAVIGAPEGYDLNVGPICIVEAAGREWVVRGAVAYWRDVMLDQLPIQAHDP